MFKDMITGSYPDYVTKNQMGDEIPVFLYHRIDRKVFEDQLRYLKDNGYQTLNIMQLGDCLVQGKNPSVKDIVMTFDDGLDDLYSVAYPLLRSYQFQAVAFIAPYWIGEEGVINWSQAQEMHQSGVIDFQAHSYTHGRIYISPKIVDFFHPTYHFYHRWQFPLLNNGPAGFEKQLPPLGMPIYQHASSLAGSKKYFGNKAVETFCIDYVKNRGEEKFFKNPFWRSRLKKAVRMILNGMSLDHKYETTKGQTKRIEKEIKQSKKIIEEKLPGKEVIAFSYPYSERSEISNHLLCKSGYRLVFGGIEKDLAFGSLDGSCIYLRRVNGDFVYRLPGSHRSSLLKVYYNKGLRRLLWGHNY
ncbi:polysaccharide deacetylase family protein [bacterium]|nr:polysaccharide deacetylase family protein [bacterium]